MYDDRAFRGGTRPNIAPADILPGVKGMAAAELLAWLTEGHRLLRESVAALSDEELDGETRAPWGQRATRRWIVQIMIEHNLYHAGEINHLRALAEERDRWAYE